MAVIDIESIKPENRESSRKQRQREHRVGRRRLNFNTDKSKRPLKTRSIFLKRFSSIESESPNDYQPEVYTIKKDYNQGKSLFSHLSSRNLKENNIYMRNYNR